MQGLTAKTKTLFFVEFFSPCFYSYFFYYFYRNKVKLPKFYFKLSWTIKSVKNIQGFSKTN